MSYKVVFDFLSELEQRMLLYDAHSLVWEEGRQKTSYEKAKIDLTNMIQHRDLAKRSLRLLGVPEDYGCDCWVLRYPAGSFIPSHKDDAPFGSEHWRLNAIIQNGLDSEFILNSRSIDMRERDAIIFRPDKYEHAVTEVTGGTRYVWSVGILR